MLRVVVLTPMWVIAICTSLLAQSKTVPPSAQVAELRIPEVEGVKLNRQRCKLPQGLEGDLNVLIVCFSCDQQNLVDEWIAKVAAKERPSEELRCYEAILIDPTPAFIQSTITNGMRDGITDEAARDRTITFFTNKKRFLGTLGLKGEKVVHVLLVNDKGIVKWKCSGSPTKQTVEQLYEKIDAK